MAKNDSVVTTDETQGNDSVNSGAASDTTSAAAPAATPATPAPAATQSSDSRFITLTLDQEAVNSLADGRAVGSTMTRKDYIMKRWGQGIGRGPISKELTRLQGKEVPYQIVFQATNKVAGGPQPAAAPAPAPAPAAPATETPAAS
jgi:hypothetical protein